MSSLMSSAEAERHSLLKRECQEAEGIVRDIVHEDQLSSGNLSWDESPLKPWIIDQAQSILIYHHTKSSCVYGADSGSGFLICRIPTGHHSLIKWSAPLFVNLSLRSIGFCFGRLKRATFSVCTSRALVSAITAPGGRRLSGVDIGVACGHRLQDRADVLAATSGPNLSSVGVTRVTGTSLDFSYSKGCMRLDDAKNNIVYGPGADSIGILAGKVAAPTEFQPLYGELSRIVDRVERPSANPARTSASLERYSTGRDPDSVVVLPEGVVVREDLKEPPLCPSPQHSY